MKTKILLIVVMLLITSAFARSGREVGNGGGAWVCRNDGGKIEWIKLVDLFEAENEFGLSLKSYSSDYKSIVRKIRAKIKRMDSYLHLGLNPYFSNVLKGMKQSNGELEVIDDSLYRLRPRKRTCRNGTIAYEQVANFTYYGAIIIDSELFNSSEFSELDKAALVVHEAVYAYLRELYGDENSINARFITAHLFSSLSNKNILGKIKNELRYISVGAPGLELAKVKKGDVTIGGSTADWDDTKLRNCSDIPTQKVKIKTDLDVMTTEVSQQMYVSIMGANPSRYSKEKDCPASYQKVKSPITGLSVAMCPHFPVESVSKFNIEKFIDLFNKKLKAKFRLPTEAEWEYIAKAGKLSDYYDSYSIIRSYTPVQVNLPPYVGLFRDDQNKRNAFNLFDTLGGVWEATLSIKKDTDYILKGGSWKESSQFLNITCRNKENLSYRTYGTVGFRLVQSSK